MSTKGIARRYAASLYEVADKAGRVDEVGRELLAFAELVASHAGLAKAFDAPSIPATVKKDIVNALIAAHKDMAVELERTLVLMAERDRLPMLTDLAAAFQDRLNQARRIMPAEIVTAVPLSADRRTALATALGKATGGQVTMTERVDPAIVGGVVAKVGSVVYDGSLAGQLERLREKLKASA